MVPLTTLHVCILENPVQLSRSAGEWIFTSDASVIFTDFLAVRQGKMQDAYNALMDLLRVGKSTARYAAALCGISLNGLNVSNRTGKPHNVLLTQFHSIDVTPQRSYKCFRYHTTVFILDIISVFLCDYFQIKIAFGKSSIIWSR